ncbi:MAG: isoprenylcysteine carboxylmethyltransferase family protein [Oscillospiraceae bacterium]|nr:isoprenylcysteine carboxylmethyltransferase family protein [Oscillospiraceae bacterium]
MRGKLALKALCGYAAGLVLVGALIFLPAGTLSFPRGWLFLCVLFLPMLVMGLVMLVKAPDLLKRRLENKEKEQTQKTVVALSGLMFLAGFVLCGLDFRFGWTQLPLWVTHLAAIAFLFGYGMYAKVLRENSYLSRTVKVEAEQTVIDTGLYGIIRHPMYTATVLMFVMIPLILGSLAALPVFLVYPVIIVLRIRNEEQVLKAELRGYAEYCTRVKYRLLPHIW